MLLLTSAPPNPSGPVQTMVDGVLEISEQRVAKRSEREIEISKFRQSSSVKGGHAFQITDAGIVVHPRLEALLRDPTGSDPCTIERLSTGLPRLDEVTEGGFIRGSSTVMFGATGTGKTTLGLHFLNRSSASEPGLHFGFFESPVRVLLKARLLGLELEKHHRAGHLELLWHPPTERVLDALGHRLLAAVRERGVKRLFVDGIDGFVKAAPDTDRITHFMSALTNELRVLGVTSLYTSELHDLIGPGVTLPVQGLSTLLENGLLLRFVERERRLVRTLSVIKLRDSGYDDTIRELRIAPHHTDVAEPVRYSPEPVGLRLGGNTLRRSMGRWLWRRGQNDRR
jgi:circadian clock protein KaiC